VHVLVVCNHTLIGRSLVAMLQHHSASMSWEAELCGAAEAVERAREWGADVLLVDATSDFTDSLGSIRKITAECSEIGIVALGPTADEGSALAAVSAGADGYLAWDDGEDALVNALQAVLRGELGLSGKAARHVVRSLRRAGQNHASRSEVFALLTAREQEVFDLTRQGLRSREIAEILCIADSTVYKHIQNILEKLHVRNRTQAVLLTELDPLSPPTSDAL
jgi:DNA-binding NarL/FixJ family response regulator